MLHLLRTGSKTSMRRTSEKPPQPPTIITRPSGSRVAVELERASAMEETLFQGPLLGPQLSALVKIWVLLLFHPPATSTRPPGSRVAVCLPRAWFRLGPLVQVLVAGL